MPVGFVVGVMRSDFCWGEKFNKKLNKYIEMRSLGGNQQYDMSGVNGVAELNKLITTRDKKP